MREERPADRPGDQVAKASSGSSVVQAGRDVRITYRRGVHLSPRPAGAVLLAGAVAVGGLVLLLNGLLTLAVPLWVTLLAAVAGAVTALPLRRGRRVFLVTSAFSRKPWIVELMQHVHGTLNRGGLDLVLKAPEHDYDAAAQAHHLRHLARSRREYLGGLVVATEVHRLRPELVEFCADFAAPVVFVDIEPFDDETDYPPDTAFVGYLPTDIGVLAGQWLANHLTRHDVRHPHVLIVAGPEQVDRQRCCEEVLRDRVDGVSVVVDDGCAFQRSRARETVQAHVRELDARGGRLDAVFCTDDEMALGAVDALRGIHSPATADTVVIGVDGAPEVLALIDSGTGPLRATVVQDSRRLAESAIHVLERMRRGRAVPKRTALRPEIHQTNNRSATVPGNDA
ncbi:sugar ABC transporter substrate-binding protein [Saccharothrix sp. Mg75]|uniref:sugar ABC transporter substrate-binding protein n=1 Tax=Saccharothrix sp. Mg75 TaxID=3445357 RepID=UPI003EEE45DD